MKLRVLCVALALIVLGTSSSASAYHTDRKRNVSGTAFLLDKNEWQLGPFRADYGALETLQIGTYLVPWAFVVPNVQFKILVFQNERWAVSIRPGLYYADLSIAHKLYGIGPDSMDLKLWLIPLEGYVSWVIHKRFTLTVAGVYTAAAGSGSYNPEDFEGTAAASNAQVGMGFEWRVNRIVALTLQGRYIAYQDAAGVGTVKLDVDDDTDAEIHAQGSARGADASNGFSVSASALFSWQTFNLRAGVGYGNYNLPGFNLVVPERHPFPIFDMFWRF